jgi:hypothetical protein
MTDPKVKWDIGESIRVGVGPGDGYDRMMRMMRTTGDMGDVYDARLRTRSRSCVWCVQVRLLQFSGQEGVKWEIWLEIPGEISFAQGYTQRHPEQGY